MADYRLLYDSSCLYAFHLQNKKAVVEIAKVEAGKLKDKDGKESRKPFVYFRGKKLPLALNKTNGATIAGLYGKDTAGWVGKRVELYPTTTQAFGKLQDCIRITNTKPSATAGAAEYDEDAQPPEATNG